jgi:hypothetical protein
VDLTTDWSCTTDGICARAWWFLNNPRVLDAATRGPLFPLLFQTSLEPIGGCVNLELFCTLDFKTWFEQSLVVASETLVGRSKSKKRSTTQELWLRRRNPTCIIIIIMIYYYYAYNKLHYFGVLSLWWDVFCFYFSDTKTYRVRGLWNIYFRAFSRTNCTSKSCCGHLFINLYFQPLSFESWTLRLGAGRLLGNFDIFTCKQLSDYLYPKVSFVIK